MLQIYSSLTRTKQPFVPVVSGKVGIYLCGPTVYAPAHIGHMVGPVIFDTIKRYLVHAGYDVTLVVNITDIDDKLIIKARERGISITQLAEENTADYLHNLKEVGVNQIDHMPTATGCMEDIIRFTEVLIERGIAYESDGDVLFDVSKDPGYGRLSHRTLDAMMGEGGVEASKKRNPADFALWKQAKEGEPAWDSPWGRGRPGWHIECSAMSRRILGETFDIHGGGLDLVFPHHENEIAQSECCHDKPMAKYWLHNGLLQTSERIGKIGGRGGREALDGQAPPTTEVSTSTGKMSRSKGAGGLKDLIKRQGGERVRFFLLRTHYRSTVIFSEEEVVEAGQGLDQFHRFFERFQRIAGTSFFDLPIVSRRAEGVVDTAGDPTLAEVAKVRERYLAKMDDDFNTGGAVSELFELLRVLNRFVDGSGLDEATTHNPEKITSLTRAAITLRELSAILGLFLISPKTATMDDNLVGSLMELLIALRAEARVRKDFATSDRIRDGLASIGIILEDRKGDTGWRSK